MDFNSALDIIINDLREARNIIDNLKQHKELPLIEIELAKAKCKSAEEILTLLKELDISVGKPEKKADPTEKPAKESEEVVNTRQETKTESAGTNIILEEESDLKTVKEEEKTEQENLSPVSESKSPEPESIKTPEEPAAASPGKSKQKGVKPILADRYKDSGNRISEKVSLQKDEDDVTSKIKKKPIGSLTDAIGINDRFYFIRELFGGNKEIYNETINRLNTTGSLSEAEAIIEEFGSDDRNSDAVMELMSLIRRKPGINE